MQQQNVMAILFSQGSFPLVYVSHLVLEEGSMILKRHLVTLLLSL
jgi:hypothetical protein